jgi:hypothetical protein
LEEDTPASLVEEASTLDLEAAAALAEALEAAETEAAEAWAWWTLD